MLAVLLAEALTVTTPEEAVVLLAADAPPPSKEVFEAAKGLIETAAKQDPANPRMMLAQLAAKEEDWAAMSKAYVAAMASHAFQLIRAKKDPASALPVIERLAKIEKSDEYTADFLLGEAKSALGDCAAAVESHARVLEKQPEARNARYSIAACLEKIGRSAEAANQYD